MRRIAALALGLVLVPSAALACPGCVASPYGDRTFGWAYLLLLVAPFLIACAIAGALAYGSRAGRMATARTWPSLQLLGQRLRRVAGASAGETAPLGDVNDLDKETT